jgi:hypothetical protein
MLTGLTRQRAFPWLIGGQCIAAVAAQDLAIPVFTTDAGVDIIIDANLSERGSRRTAERKLASRKCGRGQKAQEQDASHEMGKPQPRYGSRFTIVTV